MAKPKTSHQHMMLEPREGGGFNVYQMEYVGFVPESACNEVLSLTSLKPSGRPRNSGGATARPAAPNIAAPSSRKPGAGQKRGNLIGSALRGAQVELEGDGYPIQIGTRNGQPVFIRNTDPRIYAIRYQRYPSSGIRPYSVRTAKLSNKEIFGFDATGKVQTLQVNFRQVNTAGDDFESAELEEYHTFRLTGRKRRPQDFDLDSMVVANVLPDNEYYGVQLILADRTSPAKYRGLEPVDSLIADLTEPTLPEDED